MDQDDRHRPALCFVCTGNAARSVMAATMLRSMTHDLDVRGAGTLVLEGHPMSARTRLALARHGLADPHHRSRQFAQTDAGVSDLIVVMEPLHVDWMRLRFPSVAGITATLRRLVRDLPDPVSDSRSSLAERVEALDLATVKPEGWEEIVDPAAGEQADFDLCADVLWPLVVGLHERLR